MNFPKSRLVSNIPLMVSNEFRSEAAKLELSALTSFGAFVRGSICWLAIYTMGTLAELLPVVHLLMPPFWIIIGPYAFLKVFRHFSHQLDYRPLNLNCLSCGFALPGFDFNDAVSVAIECSHCRGLMEVKLDPVIDLQGAEQDLKARSLQESLRMIRRFPWPFNTADKAALLPSLLMHLSVFVFSIASFLVISWLGHQVFDHELLSREILPWKYELSFVAQFLIGIALILICSRFFGVLFEKIGQPAVIGEVLAGVTLGPSFLGIWYPKFSDFVLMSPAGNAMHGVAEVGVILYVCLVGIDYSSKFFKSHAQTAFAISHGSILFPFLGGCLLSLALFKLGAGPGVSFSVFSLFIGVAMSVTAFPVLARIVENLELKNTVAGQISLICASIDDVIAWLLLAFVLGLHRSQVQGFLVGLVGSLVFFLVFFRLVKPLILSLVNRVEAESSFQTKDFIQIITIIMLVSLATSSIGIHSLLGAFLVGMVIPQGSLLAKEFMRLMKNTVSVFFLPVFFAYSGMRTEIGTLNTFEDWFLCILVLIVAIAGKVGGAFISARLLEVGVRQSAAIGFLLNTRGLVELVILNIGMDAGIITPKLFSMFVIMTVVTTLMTSPSVKWILNTRSKVST